MDIELNKVTWYSKLAAVVLFVGVFGLGFYLGKEYETVSPAATTTPEAPAAGAASGNTTPATPAVPKSVPAEPKGNYKALVTMTATGFSPNVVTVTAGETVRFVNGTKGTMRIYSNTNLGSPTYPGFDQQKSGGSGSIFDFLFNKPGVWGYHNLNGDPKVTGTVIVKAQ
ncbi:MAG: hypothetical protein AAB923_02890 [Patescibacteria group bacterium]